MDSYTNYLQQQNTFLRNLVAEQRRAMQPMHKTSVQSMHRGRVMHDGKVHVIFGSRESIKAFHLSCMRGYSTISSPKLNDESVECAHLLAELSRTNPRDARADAVHKGGSKEPAATAAASSGGLLYKARLGGVAAL